MYIKPVTNAYINHIYIYASMQIQMSQKCNKISMTHIKVMKN